MTTLLAAWLVLVVISNAGFSAQAGSINSELEKNAAPGNINFDDSEFWFTNKFLSTNWKSVMLHVAPFLDKLQRDIVMTNAGHKRINPLVIITELVLKHQSDSSASTDYGEIAESFTDSLLQFDDIFQQLQEKPKPNAATFSLWSALDKDDETLAQFVSLHKELSGHKSISPDASRSSTYQEVNDREAFSMQFPWAIGDSWYGGGTHSTTGSGKVWSSLDFNDGKQNGWGSTTPWVAAAHSGTVKVFSECNIQITHSSGYGTEYYHMEDLKFKSGDQVTAGQAIGRYADDKATALCRGGASTGPHVHFTLLKNGRQFSLQDQEICGYKINAGTKNYDTNCDRFFYVKNDKKTCAWRKLHNKDCAASTSPNPTPNPNTVTLKMKLKTKRWGDEISWTFGTCSSKRTYGNHKNYSQECKLAPGTYTLTCKDSYGDGWNGGYITIQGKKYCHDFNCPSSGPTYCRDQKTKTVQVTLTA